MIQTLSIFAPLLAMVVILSGNASKLRLHLLPVAALPALLYSLLGDADHATVFSWTILQSHLGLRYSGPIFLFFVAGLWTIAGWFAAGYIEGDPAARRFSFFWLLTLCGNLGVVLAGDVPTFYTFFAVMTFSAYGLIAHTEKPEAWRAGRVYIILAVAAEAMLLAGLLLAVSGADSYLLKDAAAAVADSPQRNLIILLILTGFGVKAGMVPLHFWLPLAHPVAPTPASAVLSGAMIKAGLLGWIQFLPGGHGDLPAWSIVIVCLGLITTFYGVACGLPQREPKTVLAYSSISQMGVMLIVVGAGLANADAWRATLVVLAIYALNHGFSKGSLFLGVGVCSRWAGAGSGVRRLVLAGLILPSLAIAGAPLMGGAIAKYAVKGAAEDVPSLLAPWLLILLPLSAVATTLLLGRFFLLARCQLMQGRMAEKPHKRRQTELWAWLMSIAASIFAVHFSLPWFALELRTAQPGFSGFWENLWPILTGALLLGILIAIGRKGSIEWSIPPGDLVTPLSRGVIWLGHGWQRFAHPERWGVNVVPAIERAIRSSHVKSFFSGSEAVLKRVDVTAFLILCLLFLIWILLS